MKSRSGTSVKEHKNHKTNSNQAQASDGAIYSRAELADLTCPITQELFFEPVLAMPCGHGFESRASGGLLKCPSCRQDIVMFGAALAQRSEMDKVLSNYPALYKKVYFNLDHFAEVVSKNELTKPTGERFIKLLQHAAKYLNDKAMEGKQKDKTAIEILASTYQGRELLRKDEKIRSLLSSESLQLKVNGQTIDEWIKMEKEESKATPVQSVATPVSPVSVSGLFASSIAPPNNNVSRVVQPQPDDTVWQRVVHGDEVGVLQMIRATPHLVEEKATVYDYSNRAVDDATPYQAAIRAGDEVMAEKIKAIYLVANPENGQAVLDAQFNEVFPNGYAAYLAEQKRSANDFECDYLNPLVDAMTNASPADLRAALDKRDNGSALCQALNAFKVAFTTLSHREKVFNPNHLLKAFEKYNATLNESFDSLMRRYVIDGNPDHWLLLNLFWRQMIGWEERYMTTNYAQSFCTGLGNMVDYDRPLERVLNLRNVDTGQEVNFFPLDADPASGLGSDFAAYSNNVARGCAGCADVGGRAAWGQGWYARCDKYYKSYIEQKQQAWLTYAARAGASSIAFVRNQVM